MNRLRLHPVTKVLAATLRVQAAVSQVSWGAANKMKKRITVAIAEIVTVVGIEVMVLIVLYFSWLWQQSSCAPTHNGWENLVIYAGKKLGSDKNARTFLQPFLLADVNCLTYQGIYKLCLNWYMFMINWRLSKSGIYCHMNVSRAQVYNSLMIRVFFNSPLTSYGIINDRRLRKLNFRKTFLKSSHESFALALG